MKTDKKRNEKRVKRGTTDTEGRALYLFIYIFPFNCMAHMYIYMLVYSYAPVQAGRHGTPVTEANTRTISTPFSPSRQVLKCEVRIYSKVGFRCVDFSPFAPYVAEYLQVKKKDKLMWSFVMVAYIYLFYGGLVPYMFHSRF